jgi:Outer membrane protein beta-barrel domain
MRRLLLTASVAVACATVAQPANAQVSFGVQGALITGLEEVQAGDLNGTMGLGGRVQFSPPIPGFALGIVGQGVYYFPDIDDLSYMTYGLGAKVGLSTPVVSPYVIGGWQWRRSSFGDFTNTETGPTVGVGVQLGMIPAFLEVTMEFNEEDEIDPDFDTDPLIIQAGVLIGG